MKKSIFCLLIIVPLFGNAQDDTNQINTDDRILGTWHLFKMIENLSGEEIIPPKPHDDFQFAITFQDSIVKFNLEINKCENSYAITGKHQIKFLYYDECTKICCDKYFSTLLIYEHCTNYYIVNEKTLVLTSEDRIFYFSKAE